MSQRADMIMGLVRKLGSSMTLNAEAIRAKIEQEVSALETDLFQRAEARQRSDAYAEELRCALKALVDDEWRCTPDWGNPEERRAILDRCNAALERNEIFHHAADQSDQGDAPDHSAARSPGAGNGGTNSTPAVTAQSAPATTSVSRRFLNEHGRAIEVWALRRSNGVELSIEGPDSVNTNEITLIEAHEIHRALGAILNGIAECERDQMTDLRARLQWTRDRWQDIVEDAEALAKDLGSMPALLLGIKTVAENERFACDAALSESLKSGDAQDAARWRWWCKWWFDEKDDMEKLNGLEYEDQATLNAAVDSEIASESHKPDSPDRGRPIPPHASGPAGYYPPPSADSSKG